MRKEAEINGSISRQFEDSLFRQKARNIAGVDEAGRGPLAGPVVAAAVILPKGVNIDGINDSKQISSLKREQLLPVIINSAISVGIGVISEYIIDQINIFKATRIAMARSVANLSIIPDHLLIDGNFCIDYNLPQTSIVRGDSLSISIASASIIAKVTRDRLMKEIDNKYPQYSFRKHKGYGTKEHMAMIRRHGPCEVHRKTFKGVKEWL